MPTQSLCLSRKDKANKLHEIVAIRVTYLEGHAKLGPNGIH